MKIFIPKLIPELLTRKQLRFSPLSSLFLLHTVMDSSGQSLEPFNQAQSQGSAEDNIAPAPIKSPLSRQPTVVTGDAEWLRYNLLSLGCSACISRIGPN